MRILPSALKRPGIDETHITHVLRHAISALDEDETFTMLLGPDQSGRLLEVGVVDIDGEDPRVIHAMPIRAKYQRHIPRW